MLVTTQLLDNILPVILPVLLKSVHHYQGLSRTWKKRPASYLMDSLCHLYHTFLPAPSCFLDLTKLSPKFPSMPQNIVTNVAADGKQFTWKTATWQRVRDVFNALARGGFYRINMSPDGVTLICFIVCLFFFPSLSFRLHLKTACLESIFSDGGTMRGFPASISFHLCRNTSAPSKRLSTKFVTLTDATHNTHTHTHFYGQIPETLVKIWDTL